MLDLILVMFELVYLLLVCLLFTVFALRTLCFVLCLMLVLFGISLLVWWFVVCVGLLCLIC